MVEAEDLYRPTFIDINLAAIAHNFAQIKALVGSTKIMSVVKANAYGHGLIECSRHFEKLTTDYLGVALVEEGIEIRQAGIKTPILVFGGIVGGQIDQYLKYDLDITASSIDKLKAIDSVAANLGKKAKIHLKIDTGMRRIGVRPESAPALIESALNAKHCELVGVFSHFANADIPDRNLTQNQLHEFLTCLGDLKKNHPNVMLHIANTAGVLLGQDNYLDMVRPGLGLYGITPAPHLAGKLSLKPALSLHSQLVFFKVVKAGQGISYGHTWHASNDTRVVTVPIGYGDGYQRALSNKVEVLIHGKRYRNVGTICMDQMMVDIGQDSAFNGDVITVIGRDGAEEITVNELADKAGTIPYEIFTSLNLRLPRRYR
jgi:alanine racemase